LYHRNHGALWPSRRSYQQFANRHFFFPSSLSGRPSSRCLEGEKLRASERSFHRISLLDKYTFEIPLCPRFYSFSERTSPPCSPTFPTRWNFSFPSSCKRQYPCLIPLGFRDARSLDAVPIATHVTQGMVPPFLFLLSRKQLSRRFSSSFLLSPPLYAFPLFLTFLFRFSHRAYFFVPFCRRAFARRFCRQPFRN